MKYKIGFIISFIYAILITIGLIWVITQPKHIESCTIWEKYEHSNCFYVLMEQEVSIDDYIRYEIGDEYEYIVYDER